MFNQIYTNNIKNPELVHLISQIKNLSRDSKKNGIAIVALLKRIAPLAKSENEQSLYLESLRELIFYVDRYEDSYSALYYAELFFRTCAQYLSTNQLSDIASLRIIVFAYHNAFMTCYRFAQIDDAKLEKFWTSFRHVCEKCNLMLYYWMSQTDLALIYQDKETAKYATIQLEKQPFDPIYCYACRKQSVMGTYIMQNDLESCKMLAHQILSHEIPEEHLKRYPNCQKLTIIGLYSDLIEFAVWSANSAALDYFLPQYTNACHEENVTEKTILCYCHAVSGDFTHIANDLDYMVTIEMDKNAEERRRWSAWNTIITSLTWIAYLKKLLQSGVDAVVLKSLPEDLSFDTRDGLYLVQPLIEWWEIRADNAGHAFEISRNKFHYEPLKKNYMNMCGV